MVSEGVSGAPAVREQTEVYTVPKVDDGMECNLGGLTKLAETYLGAEARQDLKHFIVRRLEGACLGTLLTMPICDRQRFKQCITSLAIPISMIIPETQEGAGRAVRDFSRSLDRLAKYTAGDLHLDIIKFDSALSFQRAVNDVDPHELECNFDCSIHTGHEALAPSSAVQKAPFRKVFVGFLLKLVTRQVARAREGNLAARRFCASYLLSKRGWPQLCDHKLHETIGDHQKYLTMVPPPVSTELLEEIRRVTMSIFRKTTLSKMSPSLHASRDSSRKNLGAFGEVIGLVPNIVLPLRTSTSLLYVRTQTQEVPIFDLRRQAEVIEGRPSAREYHQAISTWKWKLFQKLERNMDDFSDVRKSVRAQAIAEPGKFRMITAGDGFQYTWLQPLQGSLLDNWKICRYSTMADGWEEEVRGWVAPAGWVWNSGDYKAATDQLNIRSTMECFETIRRIYNLGSDFESGLDGVEITYTAKDAGTHARSVWQTNGQLMGHPLSFPILCVVNLAGLKAAIRRGYAAGALEPGEGRMILAMTKINGDDILFPCPKRFCAIWQQTASELGLQLSVGKSYASEDFAMVNNVMFNKRRGGGERFGYLNQKLILNFSLKSGESEKTPLEIGRAFNAMFEHCPEAKAFLPDCVRNRQDTKILGYQPNFFIPCELGGFGVRREYAVKAVKTTRLQRQVAACMAEGVLNPFLFSRGIVVPTGSLRQMMKSLPKPVLESVANVSRFDERRHVAWGGFVDGGGFEVDLAPREGDEYKAMVAAYTQFAAPADVVSRRIKLRKMARVNPMKNSKIFEGRYRILYPQLPKMENSLRLKYQRREAEEEFLPPE
jgi:hypothetical protein